MRQPKTFLISRTDSIGDVVLTLPMAAAIKNAIPGATVAFLGKSYTKKVIQTCEYVDEFVDLDTFMQEDVRIKGEKVDCIIHVLPKSRIAKRAKQLHIPLRIGTTNRLFHWWTCNKLIRLSRKNSNLHETQLNLKLLKPFIVEKVFPLSEIPSLYGFAKIDPLEARFKALIDKGKTNLILHPKSQGNGQEWSIEYYIELIKILSPQKFKIFVSGTSDDRAKLEPLFAAVSEKVTDLTGQMDMSQFIAFINASDVLMASGTGPLHLAAALGIKALGIFPPIRPIHPGRWQPIGIQAATICAPLENGDHDAEYYIKKITPTDIANKLNSQ